MSREGIVRKSYIQKLAYVLSNMSGRALSFPDHTGGDDYERIYRRQCNIFTSDVFPIAVDDQSDQPLQNSERE